MVMLFETQEQFVSAVDNLYFHQLLDCMTYFGISSTTEYVISDDGTKFLLPCDNRDVLGIDWRECPSLRIVLPDDMSRCGLSHTNTFKYANVLTNGNNEYYFGDEHISTNGMFEGVIFKHFEYGLTIRDSALDVKSMFHRSSGLLCVTFKNCELSGFDNLFTNSNVRYVTFENCSNDEALRDNYRIASNVFNCDMTRVTLKSCEPAFVATIIAMFDVVDGFENLEIEILD